MGSLNYRHLYQFWVVAQEGSLVAAGRRLGIGHSTISTQLKALEGALGGRLLLRRPRGVRLTPLGELVRSYGDDIFRLGGELAEVAREHQGRTTRLRVGMLPCIPRALLYDALRPAMAQQRGCPLEITVADLPALSSALITGRMHLAIVDRLPARTDHARLHGQVLSRSRVGLYGTPKLVRQYASRFPQSLDGAPMLLPATGTALRDGLNAWFSEYEIRPRIVGEFDDVPTMKGFGARGHGLVPVREVLAEDARYRYGLWPVGPLRGLLARLYALTPGKRVRHPGAQRLLDDWRSRQSG